MWKEYIHYPYDSGCLTINKYLQLMKRSPVLSIALWKLVLTGIHSKKGTWKDGVFEGAFSPNLSHDHLDYQKLLAEYRRMPRRCVLMVIKKKHSHSQYEIRNGSLVCCKKYSSKERYLCIKSMPILGLKYWKFSLVAIVEGRRLIMKCWTRLIGDFNAIICWPYMRQRIYEIGKIGTLRLLSWNWENVEWKFQYYISKEKLQLLLMICHSRMP